jgi:AraC-like DNA-binding protein
MLLACVETIKMRRQFIGAGTESRICRRNLIAKYLGVTPRYVHMLFEPERLSLSQYIVAERLSRAKRLLTDPRVNDRTISDIAFDVGFRDLSHFNRVFRRRFAQTPSDVRQDAVNHPDED